LTEEIKIVEGQDLAGDAARRNMNTEEQPTNTDNSPQGNTTHLIAGISGVLGLLISLLGVLIGIINWPSERKIILGLALFVTWGIVEFVFWNQRRKRVSKKKLPWLIGLFVDVKKHLDPDSIKYLKDEQIFQSLRWAFVSFIGIIVLAGGLDWGEFKLGPILNPPTLSPTPTQTLTMTPSSTATLTPSPKPFSDSIYYVIVYDSSQNMDETFHGQKKWEVARNLLIEIINGLNSRAQFNSVVIGGSDSADGTDPCNSPASLTLPSFSTKGATFDYLKDLRPQGGGSFYKAYSLAKNQLQDLPADTARTLIYITGASDTCETEDEWNAIKNLMSISDSTLKTFSQIIILDDDGIKSRTLAEQFNSLADENVNAQAPQSLPDIQTGGVTINNVVNNITTYETNIITSISVNAPASPVAATQKPGETRVVAPTNIPTTIPTSPPTLVPTFTKTVVPSITSSPQPSCQLISPSINTASFGGSAWINFPVHCTLDIKPGEAVSASGGYSNLPPNTIVWVFVYPPNGPFYPQSPNACAGPPSPYPSQGGGGWSVPAYFGNPEDTSKLFDLIVMVTDHAGSNFIGQRLYEDCSNDYFDGISAGELAGLNITTKATINIKTR
jgi:hypothetical protein